MVLGLLLFGIGTGGSVDRQTSADHIATGLLTARDTPAEKTNLDTRDDSDAAQVLHHGTDGHGELRRARIALGDALQGRVNQPFHVRLQLDAVLTLTWLDANFRHHALGDSCLNE